MSKQEAKDEVKRFFSQFLKAAYQVIVGIVTFTIIGGKLLFDFLHTFVEKKGPEVKRVVYTQESDTENG